MFGVYDTCTLVHSRIFARKHSRENRFRSSTKFALTKHVLLTPLSVATYVAESKMMCYFIFNKFTWSVFTMCFACAWSHMSQCFDQQIKLKHQIQMHPTCSQYDDSVLTGKGIICEKFGLARNCVVRKSVESSLLPPKESFLTCLAMPTAVMAN